MQKEDKVKLFLLAYGIFFAGLAAAFAFFVSQVSPWILGGAVALFHFGRVLPKVCVQYSKLYGAPVNWKLWIPWWNMVMVFPPGPSKLLLAGGIVIAVILVPLLLSYFQVPFMETVAYALGDRFAMNYVFYSILILLTLYLIFGMIVSGVGFIEMKRNVEREYRQRFSSHGKIMQLFERFHYIFMFFPFLRTLALASLLEKLNKLLVFNDLDDIDVEQFETHQT